MSYSALTAAETAQDAFITAELMDKIKDNFAFLYGEYSEITALINGSFETDADADGVPDNWTKSLYPGGSGAFETASPAHGAKSWKFIHPGGAGNGGGYLTSDYVGCSELITYFVSFILWASAAGMKNIVRISYYTAAKVAVSSTDIYSSTANPTSETAYNLQFTPPATARFFKILLIGGYTDTDVAGSVYFDNIQFGEAIAQGHLKTSYFEAAFVAGSSELVEITGGEYAHWPQVKITSTNDGYAKTVSSSSICNGFSSSINTAYHSYAEITFADEGAGSVTLKFRYHTSSGEIFWIFIKRDKLTRKVKCASAAPDHPCFGNGGKPLLVPHPFGKYDPETEEIIVINPSAAQLSEMKRSQAVGDEDKPDRSLIGIILSDYEIDEESDPAWPDKAVTVASADGADWKSLPEGTPVLVRKKIIPRPENVLIKSIKLKESLRIAAAGDGNLKQASEKY